MTKINWKAKFGYAFSGLKILLKDTSVRIQLANAAIAIALSFLFRFTYMEKIIVVVLCALVITLEAVNSSIEVLASQLDSSCDAAIGRVKDMMAGCVLIASAFSLVIGLIFLLRHIKEVFG